MRSLASSCSISVPHVPVMSKWVARAFVQNLGCFEELRIVDGTIGAGGHSKLLLEAFADSGKENVKIFGVDRDPYALDLANETLKDFRNQVELIHGNFDEVENLVQKPVHGILLDLGVSSMQLDDGSRGFSIKNTGRLDMRMDPAIKIDAWEVVNKGRQGVLEEIISRYGDEVNARRIAMQIVKERNKALINTTEDLVRALGPVLNWSEMKTKPRHPATKIFQAIRIAVNDELIHLQRAMKRLPKFIAKDGIIAVLSFHSLEDKIVADAINKGRRLKRIFHGSKYPSKEEKESNPRSRSAKFRAAKVVVQD